MEKTEELEKLAEEVKSEVKKVSDIKGSVDQLNTDFHEFKKTMEENVQDIVRTEKLEKLETSISAHQEALDEKAAAIKAANERLDQFEVALKRPHGAANQDSVFIKNLNRTRVKLGLPELEDFALIKEFNNIRRIKDKGLSDASAEEMAEYRKAFGSFMRKEGDGRHLSPEDVKSLSIGSDPDGGYMVYPEMMGMIATRQFERDPIRELASVISISTDALEALQDIDQASAAWEGETQATSETDTPKVKKLRIPVHVLAVRPRATQNFLDDAAINAEQWLANKIADIFSRTEAASFVTGDGASKPRGFLTYSHGTDDFDADTIQQVPISADGSTISADELITLRYTPIEFYLNRATWLMNRTTVAAIMKLKDGNGDYLWKPGLERGQPSTLLGLPTRMSTTMPAVAANALSVALADWGEAYQIVDRIGINVLRDPYTVKPFVEFYTRKRVGGAVKNTQAIKIGKVATSVS